MTRPSTTEREMQEIIKQSDWPRLVALLQFKYHELEPTLPIKCQHLNPSKKQEEEHDWTVLVKLKQLYLYVKYPELRGDQETDCSKLISQLRLIRKYIVTMEMRLARHQQLLRQQSHQEQRRIVRTRSKGGKTRYEMAPINLGLIVIAEEEKRELIQLARDVESIPVETEAKYVIKRKSVLSMLTRTRTKSDL